MKKTKGLVKGASSGFMISLLVHAGAFLLAGMLVVFTVQQKKEKKFVPPKPVERPKMKLKKPKVKVKKSARPKSSKRIVTKVQRANMPDIRLPEMSGLGVGLGDGMGDGFSMMPDLGEVTMFGSVTSIGNDLEGTLYDLKRLSNGRVSGIYETEGIQAVVEKFIRSGWRRGALSRFYQSPKKLYTPMVMVPPTESALGPWAFGERDMDPWAYLLHYKGNLVHAEGIKFRFVVMGDNYLAIRVNGKVVMDYKNQFEAAINHAPFRAKPYHFGHWYAYESDWIELEPGIPQSIEMILGDYKGGLFSAMIAVEEYGKDYPRTPIPQYNPQLPIFKTASLSRDQVEVIYQRMWKGHIDLINGPVFSDYDSGSNSTNALSWNPIPIEPSQEIVTSDKAKPRLWTLADGKSIEARYVNFFSGRAVLESVKGKVFKVLPSELSEKDQEHLEILNPPKLSLEFKRDTKQFEVRVNPESNGAVPTAFEFAGGALVKQEDRLKDYQRPLRMELYVIADEYDGDNFILFDRQVEDFTLTPENGRRFEHYGRKDILLRYEHYSETTRGEKYKGYMILVFNERNEIIASNMSHDWLLPIRDKLLTFPVGRHFNKQGDRVFPPRPPFTDKYWEHDPGYY